VIQIPTRPEKAQTRARKQFRGVVEHVGTGRRQPFANAHELIAFLRGDHGDPLNETEGRTHEPTS